jgi:tetratricopeptide (TPR) repeat protein
VAKTVATTAVVAPPVLLAQMIVVGGWRSTVWTLDFYATRAGLHLVSACLRRCLPEPLVAAQRGYFAYRRGALDEALRAVEPVLDRALADPVAWVVVMNVLIGAGRYRDALRGLDQPWRAPPRGPLARFHHSLHLFQVEVNEAEALQNLGDERAVRHVQSVPRSGASMFAMHQAWAHASRGDLAAAEAARRGIAVRRIPADWRAEGCYAGAFVHLLARDLDAAEREVRRGLARAVRASSKRNGTYLLATVAHRRGQTERALALFAEAAEHPYRGQGGAALLEWGDLLAEVGRRDDAARAWQLVLERDPESAAAEVARGRLAPPTA